MTKTGSRIKCGMTNYWIPAPFNCAQDRQVLHDTAFRQITFALCAICRAGRVDLLLSIDYFLFLLNRFATVFQKILRLRYASLRMTSQELFGKSG